MSDTKKQNKTILIYQPNSDNVMLVISVILDPTFVDLEQLLAAMVPEMAQGQVSGGLLLIGDTALVLRNTGEQVMVDEVSLGELLALAGLDTSWTQETIVSQLQRWVEVMAMTWRDRLVGPLRKLLVPHLVAGLNGEVRVVDGVWGLKAARVATEE